MLREISAPGLYPIPMAAHREILEERKRRMAACKRSGRVGESGDGGSVKKCGRMKQLILEIHLMEKLVHVW